MIEIGKNFLFGLSTAKQTSRAQQEKYKLLADQTDALAQQLRQHYEEKTAYLFRSSTEKMRQIQQAAQAALAQRQARRAAHGVNDQSASAVQDATTTALAAALDTARTQAQLQSAGAQQENTFKAKWQALLQAAADYRRSSRKKGRLGSLGQAFSSLFK